MFLEASSWGPVIKTQVGTGGNGGTSGILWGNVGRPWQSPAVWFDLLRG